MSAERETLGAVRLECGVATADLTPNYASDYSKVWTPSDTPARGSRWRDGRSALPETGQEGGSLPPGTNVRPAGSYRPSAAP